MYVDNLPRVALGSAAAGIRTRDLFIIIDRATECTRRNKFIKLVWKIQYKLVCCTF